MSNVENLNKSDKSVNKKGCLKNGLIILGLFFIIFIILGLFGVFDSNSSTNAKEEKEEKEEKLKEDSTSFYNNVQIVAQLAIEDRLKCPSTADFVYFQVIPFNSCNIGDTVRVIATFDAQNSFGAMIRNKMVVDEKITGDYHNDENFETLRVMTVKQMYKSELKKYRSIQHQ